MCLNLLLLFCIIIVFYFFADSYKEMNDSRLKEYVGELGVWPALHPDTWNQSDYDFIDMLTTGQRLGVTDLFRATVYGNAEEKFFINGKIIVSER